MTVRTGAIAVGIRVTMDAVALSFQGRNDVRVELCSVVGYLYLAFRAGIGVLSDVSSPEFVQALPSFDKTLTNDLSA